MRSLARCWVFPPRQAEASFTANGLWSAFVTIALPLSLGR